MADKLVLCLVFLFGTHLIEVSLYSHTSLFLSAKFRPDLYSQYRVHLSNFHRESVLRHDRNLLPSNSLILPQRQLRR